MNEKQEAEINQDERLYGGRLLRDMKLYSVFEGDDVTLQYLIARGHRLIGIQEGNAEYAACFCFEDTKQLREDLEDWTEAGKEVEYEKQQFLL